MRSIGETTLNLFRQHHVHLSELIATAKISPSPTAPRLETSEFRISPCCPCWNCQNGEESEVTYRPCSAYLNGHDRILPHDDQTPYPPAAQYAQVRPRREEEGAFPGGDQGWTSEINRGLRLRFPFTPVFAICDLYDGMALLGGRKSYCCIPCAEWCRKTVMYIRRNTAVAILGRGILSVLAVYSGFAFWRFVQYNLDVFYITMILSRITYPDISLFRSVTFSTVIKSPTLDTHVS